MALAVCAEEKVAGPFEVPVMQERVAPGLLWQADLGNGFYKNPVLYADYSDPDVVAVGDDFYMTASSFNSAPGLPILHSRDLVNWSLLGYALKKLVPEDVFAVPQHGNGVWAPNIRFHDGKVWLLHAWAKSRSGKNNILTLHKMSRDGTEVADEGKVIINGHELPATVAKRTSEQK